MTEQTFCEEPAVVIHSGGMDSTVLLHKLREERIAPLISLGFNYGQKHATPELDAARRYCLRHDIPRTVINLRNIGEHLSSSALIGSNPDPIPTGHYADPNMRATVVPNRNMIMLAIATGFAINNGARRLYYGAHAGDHAIYPDCRKDFAAAMTIAIDLCHYPDQNVQLIAPFIDIDKTAVAKIGRGLDFGRYTWSCYKGGAIHCGACGTCIERREALQNAGITDNTPYRETPDLPPPPEDKPCEPTSPAPGP